MIVKFINYINENIDIENQLWYHSSYFDNIKIFNTRVDNSKNKLGTYFSNKIKESQRYGIFTYVAKLHLKKILDLTKYGDTGYDNYKNFLKELPIPESTIKYMVNGKLFFNLPNFIPYMTLESLNKEHDIIRKLKSRGYDSIMFKENDSITTVVFDPTIIEIVDFHKVK